MIVQAFPISDFGVPDDDDRFERSVLDAAQHLKASGHVLVHCGAGIGRTGMYAIAVLLALEIPRGTARLSPRTFCKFLRELSSRRRTPRIVLEELRGVSQRPMIIRMTTTSRPQQRYDHRLRDLVPRTGDLTIATDLGVPRSTARGWLGAAPAVVVSLEAADLTETELRQEILKLRRRVEKLAALLRLTLALLHTSGFGLSGERLPDGQAKQRILRAVDRARECIPLRAVLRFMRVSPSRLAGTTEGRGDRPVFPAPCRSGRPDRGCRRSRQGSDPAGRR